MTAEHLTSGAVAVPLSRGRAHALVDEADAPLVMRFNWYVKPHGRTCYAVRNIRRADGRRGYESMHTLLTGYVRTDHRNGDGLDNRRANLRPATWAENRRNARKRSDAAASRFKGVRWHRRRGRWYARIKADGRQMNLGWFQDEELAARAYDDAARKLFGAYACVNFPQPGERCALTEIEVAI